MSIFAQSTDEVILIGKLDKTVFDQSWATEWKEAQNAYKPDSTIIEKLKVFTDKLSFVIVLGTWCSDSRDLLPQFFNVAKACGFRYELIGVDREKKCPLEDCSNWDYTLVPTIVVMKDGKEAGRIVETVKVSIENDLIRIIEN